MKPSNDREAIDLIVQGITDKGVAIDFIYDGVEDVPVSTKADVLDVLGNLDDGFLFVIRPDGVRGWIRFVMGNEPEDVVCDYSVNLTEFIDSITDPWWK